MKVGTRVKIVRNLVPKINPEANSLIGKESVITGTGAPYAILGFDIILADFPSHLFHPSELEPIIPEGHKAGDFQSCEDLLDDLKSKWDADVPVGIPVQT